MIRRSDDMPWMFGQYAVWGRQRWLTIAKCGGRQEAFTAGNPLHGQHFNAIGAYSPEFHVTWPPAAFLNHKYNGQQMLDNHSKGHKHERLSWAPHSHSIHHASIAVFGKNQFFLTEVFILKTRSMFCGTWYMPHSWVHYDWHCLFVRHGRKFWWFGH